jgi:hypothetical protein
MSRHFLAGELDSETKIPFLSRQNFFSGFTHEHRHQKHPPSFHRIFSHTAVQTQFLRLIEAVGRFSISTTGRRQTKLSPQQTQTEFEHHELASSHTRPSIRLDFTGSNGRGCAILCHWLLLVETRRRRQFWTQSFYPNNESGGTVNQRR